MIKLGDFVHSRGDTDRWGRKVACKNWTVVALEQIADSGLHSLVAYGESLGQPLWLTGRFDPKGKPGHPPEKVLLLEAEVFTLESSAWDYHQERVTGDIY